MVVLSMLALSYGIVTSQNNMLYLFFAVLALCLIVGWIGPSILSRFVRIRRRLPSTTYEGHEISLNVRVRNPNRLFQVPSVVLEGLGDTGGYESRPVLVGSLTARSYVDFQLPIVFPRRGQWYLGNRGGLP